MVDKIINKVKMAGTYTMVLNDNSEIVSMKNQMIQKDMAGTYTIVIDDNLEIASVTHNGQLMKKRSDLDPDDKHFKPEGFEKEPASGKVIVPKELKHGCVGFGSISESLTETDPCRWLWGTWW